MCLYENLDQTDDYQFKYFAFVLLLSHSILSDSLPLSTGFSRQEYWSGLPFPSLGYSL